MPKSEGQPLTWPNQEIINYTHKQLGLSDTQRLELEDFSRLDDEWRMLMALGDRYAGSADRLEELDQIRTRYLDPQNDPVLAKIVKEYVRQVDVAQFENEP